MTTFNTGNPIGSTDARDLSDNAENFDAAMNGPDTTWTDRLGNVRRTWAGAVGYEILNPETPYTVGIEVQRFNQVVLADGEFWRAAAGTTLPYTTTGAGMPEGGAFVSVGDAVLRQDLADPAQGGALVQVSTSTGEQPLSEALESRWLMDTSTGQGQALNDALDERVILVNSISNLESIPQGGITIGQVAFLSDTESGRMGHFEYKSGDFSSEVSSDTSKGIYIAPSDNSSGSLGVWERSVKDKIWLNWFSIDLTGTNYNDTQFSEALAIAESRKMILAIHPDSLGNNKVKFSSTSTVVLNIDKTGLYAPSLVEMSYEDITTGFTAFQVLNSDIGVLSGGENILRANPVAENIVFRGPGNDVSGTVLFFMGATNAQESASPTTYVCDTPLYRNVQITGWSRGQEVGNNCWGVDNDHGSFYDCNEAGFYYPPDLVNSGENMTFRATRFNNSSGSAVYQDNSSGQPGYLHFVNCSFDYIAMPFSIAGGHRRFVNCHFESNATTTTNNEYFTPIGASVNCDTNVFSDCLFLGLDNIFSSTFTSGTIQYKQSDGFGTGATNFNSSQFRVTSGTADYAISHPLAHPLVVAIVGYGIGTPPGSAPSIALNQGSITIKATSSGGDITVSLG